MVQPTLQKMSLKEAHESFSSTSRGLVHEDRRLQSRNSMNGGRTNQEHPTNRNYTKTSLIPLQINLSTVEVSHPKFDTFKKRKGAPSSAGPTTEIRHPLLQFPRRPQEELFQILRAQPLIAGCYIDWATVEQVQMADAIRALLTIDPWELFFGIIEPTYLKLTMELCSTFHLQTIMTNYDDPGTCWHTLAPGAPSYNPSRSKASALPPSLRHLHAILAHTITGRCESTGVINTHDAYFLWCMSQGHDIDLAYFIALAIQHQKEWHRKGVVSIVPYMTRLA
ncbi:hypothetical protein GOBAR_AA06827 [Gossypium barbadense]|uniref:Uncharacterized protein n=1 Tax=Gossypium barbadense TaxID=3634 RepID=A0A2P5YDZ5_GOSBA|nr:hypothetical protein GOBAR_AA06827 [Gossypium barbadense]